MLCLATAKLVGKRRNMTLILRINFHLVSSNELYLVKPGSFLEFISTSSCIKHRSATASDLASDPVNSHLKT